MRGNLVGVISNGTAVLGLGNIGALASKPVMEGKAVLFKKFANIDCFDIELDEPSVDLLLFVHRVEGLPSGMYYFLRRAAGRWEATFDGDAARNELLRENPREGLRGDCEV